MAKAASMRSTVGNRRQWEVRMVSRERNQAHRWRVSRRIVYQSDRQERVQRTYAVIAPEAIRERRSEQKGESHERKDSFVCTGIE